MSSAGIPGTYVYDKELATRGYALSKMAFSLARPENREAFLRDEDAYLDRFAVTPEQRAAVKARDWLALVKLGGNIYYIFKLTALGGKPMSMADLGAAQVGLPLDEFIERNVERGHAPWPG
jgi:protocatechuate 4,5-dioxygenase alpha chain